MDFVNEKHWPAGGEHAACLPAALLDDFAHILDSGIDSGEGVEGHFDGVGYDARKGGLAHSRWTPKDERGNVALLDHGADNATGPNEMGLAYVLVEGAGSEPLGKRSIGIHNNKVTKPREEIKTISHF